MDQIKDDLQDQSGKIEIEDFSDHGFWEKVLSFCKKLGIESTRKILQLYYALYSDNCTAKHKTAILGALAYFISPLDAIPDLMPVLGFTDDMGVIVAALSFISLCIDDDVIAKTEKKLKELFG